MFKLKHTVFFLLYIMSFQSSAAIIAVGLSYSLFIDEQGQVWGMGDNNNFLPWSKGSANQMQPTVFPGLPKIEAIATRHSSLLLDQDGHVWGMGLNIAWKVGLDDTTQNYQPTMLLNLPKIKAIAIGNFHSLFLDENGGLWVMGSNRSGALGTGDYLPRDVPTKLINVPPIKGIAAGNYCSLLLDENGEVWTMGNNFFGTLGLGDKIKRNTPTKIIFAGLPEIKDMAAGGDHSLLLDVDGHVWAMGRNEEGQLGMNDRTHSRVVPTRILLPEHLPTTIKAIAAGGNNSLLLSEDGRVWSMGSIFGGSSKNAPFRISEKRLPPIKDISVGSGHSLLVDENGQMWGMGCNDTHQLALPGQYYSGLEKITTQPVLSPLSPQHYSTKNARSVEVLR